MNQSSNTYLSGAVIIVGSILVIVFGIFPMVKSLNAINHRIAGAQMELAQISTELEGYQKANAELKKSLVLKERVTAVFPKREQMVSLVESMETALGNSNLDSVLRIIDEKELNLAIEAGQIKPRPILVPGLDALQEVPYELEITGDFAQFVSFFHYFENQPMFSAYSSLVFTAESDQDEKNKKLFNTGQGRGYLEGVLFIRKD